MNNQKLIQTLVLVVILFTSCAKTEEYIPENIRLNHFIWLGMNAYYKWQNEVPNLKDDRFVSQYELNTFVKGYKSPEELFKTLKYKSGDVDRFSKLINYRELETLNVTEKQSVNISKVINFQGLKVGYLVVNNFMSEYDKSLNDVFKKFKEKNIKELIVDLRYNVGEGSIESVTNLASMITGQFYNQLFCYEDWNEKVMKNIDNSQFRYKFKQKIETDTVDEFISSLNMTKVYVIVSEKTSGLPEVLINGLKPYIDVKLIGKQTAGKQVKNIILYDSENFKKTGGKFNDSHTYVLDIVVAEYKNKNNSSENKGLIPDLEIVEEQELEVELGDINEFLLSATLNFIKK